MGLTEDNLGGLRGLGRTRVKEGYQIVLDDILNKGPAVADETDTDDNGEKRKPSVDR